MEHLKLRNEMNRQRPSFKRQQTNLLKKQSKSKWRWPVGIHSKLREGLRGKGALPAVGYRGPADVRGLNKAGLKEIIVSNVERLKGIDAKKQAVLIQGGVGKRKKVEILRKAIELGLLISNVRDMAKFIDDVQKSLAERKKKSADRKSRKEKSKEESDARKSSEDFRQVHQDELKKKDAKEKESQEKEDKIKEQQKKTESIKDYPNVDKKPVQDYSKENKE